MSEITQADIELDTDRYSVKLDNPQINFNDDRFGAVLICAVRYAMGRQTYMPGLVIGFINPLLPHISKKTLAVFKQDYERNARDEERTGWNMFGDPNIDKPEWDKFYTDVCAELEQRRLND